MLTLLIGVVVFGGDDQFHGVVGRSPRLALENIYGLLEAHRFHLPDQVDDVGTLFPETALRPTSDPLMFLVNLKGRILITVVVVLGERAMPPPPLVGLEAVSRFRKVRDVKAPLKCGNAGPV